jgi:tyrosinase
MAEFAANPLTVRLTAPGEPYYRADLEFHGVDHSKASFEGRLFINNPDAGPGTSTDDDSYAGSFWIFGHGGCAGDEGHCEPVAERRPFDFRPEHQLTAVSKRVMITGKLQALVQPGQDFTVRIVPYVRPELAEPLPANLVTDILQLDRVDLLTYQ